MLSSRTVKTALLATTERARNMSQPISTSTARREFLRFLAASPYVAMLGGVTAFLEQSGLSQSIASKAPAASDVTSSPAEALNVFDFEEAPHSKVPDSLCAFNVGCRHRR